MEKKKDARDTNNAIIKTLQIKLQQHEMVIPEKAAPVTRIVLTEDYWHCAGGLAAVKTIDIILYAIT